MRVRVRKSWPSPNLSRLISIRLPMEVLCGSVYAFNLITINFERVCLQQLLLQ